MEVAGDIEAIAAATEDCIFNEFKNTEVKYKNRIRSRVANLKVPCVCVHLSAVHVLAIFGDLVVTLVMLEIVLFILSVSFVLLPLE